MVDFTFGLMMADEIVQIREYINLLEGVSFEEPTIIEETISEEIQMEHPIIAELSDAIFKMRAFMETEGGDYALGVETGMLRAADMIENIINRQKEGK